MAGGRAMEGLRPGRRAGRPCTPIRPEGAGRKPNPRIIEALEHVAGRVEPGGETE